MNLNVNAVRQTSCRQILFQHIVVMAALHLFATFVFAQEAEITDLGVMNSDTSLLLYLNLTNGFSKEVEDGIKNGIPATFNFELSLAPFINERPGEAILRKEFSRTLAYDSLKEEYRVQSSEMGDVTVVVKDFDRAKRFMSEVRGFTVAPLASLTPGTKYSLHVMASLDERTLPFKVHYFVPFWKPWNVETEWFSTTFRYVPQKP